MQAGKLKCARAEIRTAIEDGAKGVSVLLDKLVAASKRVRSADEPDGKPPTLILPIDQGEELFVAEGGEQAEQLLHLLRDLLLADAPGLAVLFTIRSDSYERLQTAKALEGIHQQTLSLPPMPRGSYQAVIEGPAERLKDGTTALKIDPKLTHALLADIELGGGRDALPLLAFTLERLFLEYGGRGRLTLAHYEAMGRIRGSIEAAVEQALKGADADPAIPRDRDARLALLRRGLIPRLAGIDSDNGAPRRRVARQSEIPADARPLIQQLVEQRLLSTDRAQDFGEVTIEPAHEALLRQWGLLQGWLDEDRGVLTTLDGLKRAARDWVANNKNPGWLTHNGARLQEAERLRLRTDLAPHIETAEQDYLSECLRREDLERRAEEIRIVRERRNLRRVRWVLIAFAAVVAAALASAFWQSYQTSKREAAVFASEADAAFRAGLCDRALRMAEAGLPPVKGAPIWAFRSVNLEDELSRYASSQQCPFQMALPGHSRPILATTFDTAGGRILTASADGTARLWDAATGKTLTTLVGHTAPINSAVFSPDGHRIVTASDDTTARVWDAGTGALLETLAKHLAPVNAAVFSPDRRRIATASDDTTVELWDADTGAALITLSGHARRVRSVAFSTDGNRVVTASNDNTARLWDAKTGMLLASLSGHTDWVRTAVFSPDGKRIVTASEDKSARLWDVATGATLFVLSGHTGYVVGAAFSPDGSRIVTASYDKTARIWDAKTGATVATLSGHSGRLNSAAFAPNGRRVVTASDDKTARIWDATTGAALGMLAGHGEAVWCATFAPDETHVITGSLDTTSRVWDATDPLVATLSGHIGAVRSAAFSPNGGRVITASYDGTARLWDVAKGAEIATLNGHKYWLRGAIFNKDGSRIVTVSFDNTGRLWDGDGVLIAVLAHGGWVRSAAFSPDGSRVVTVSDDRTARLWDATSGAELATLSGHGDRVGDVAFSGDGTRIATAAYDNARLWDAGTGRAIATLSGHTGRVNNVAFSPDGTRVVTSSEDKTARLWDGKSGVLLATLTGHRDAVYSATFSPLGDRVLTASFDNTARLWDAKIGTPLMVLWGHGGPVNTAAFGPDGGLIVTASFDNTARIWDAATGATLLILAGHGGPVNTAAFSPDGKLVVTASEDKTARIWDVNAARKRQLDPVSRLLPDDRQDYVCRNRLIGAQAFTAVEMQDPVLADRKDLTEPCERAGLFSIDYYERALKDLWP